MKQNVRKLIIDTFQYSLYILLLQVISMQFVVANEMSENSLTEVKVTISLKNASLEEVINQIEKQTDFVFVAKGASVKTESGIDLDLKNSDLKHVLEELSNEFECSFKRINKPKLRNRKYQRCLDLI
ncbi:hypothetical protein FNH22_16830 [Fulvivirga sp. M361]|uniref:hypothetical protein n=1 Tax=Fulvivirga sp. M361 TaxID=2594266 RepID=UPI00117AA286|nr:hypothetical protein [Fulvivirga sp. M361]TRX56303.1 hypothetical protein FNH22_16830 [Fulvivirga sp. M361]